LLEAASANLSGGAMAAEKSQWGEKILQILALLFLVAVYAVGGYFLYQYWRDVAAFFGDILSLRPQSLAQAIFFVSMAMVAAVVLFKVRTKWRIHYGLLEITFGIFSALAAATPAAAGDARLSLIQLAAGVYIMVRGLDNLKIGLDERPDHPLWDLWQQRFPDNRQEGTGP
jgi:hypothetical protein